MTPEKVEATIASRRAKAEKRKKDARRATAKRANDRLPEPVARRTYHAADVSRAAYYAGQGMTAREIAVAIGGTTPGRIRALLKKLGIPLANRRQSEGALVVLFDLKAVSAFERAAVEMDVATATLVGRFLSEIGADPTLFRNLLDGVEV